MDGLALLENHYKENFEHTARCGYEHGWCGSCKKKYEDEEARVEASKSLEQRELEALDKCIFADFEKAVCKTLPYLRADFNLSERISEQRKRFEALSKQELDIQRDLWREFFYQKFETCRNWATDDDCWNSYSMYMCAKAVFDVAASRKAQAAAAASHADGDVATSLVDCQAAAASQAAPSGGGNSGDSSLDDGKKRKRVAVPDGHEIIKKEKGSASQVTASQFNDWFTTWKKKYEDWLVEHGVTRSHELRELDALDACILREFETFVLVSYPYLRHKECFFERNSEVRKRFDALSEQELAVKRDFWRKKYYTKFASNQDWQKAHYKFWDNVTMWNGAEAVFYLAAARQIPAAQATAAAAQATAAAAAAAAAAQGSSSHAEGDGA